MISVTAISKNLPRGKPFPKGIGGNPMGRPKRTPEEVALAEACRAKTSEALGIIEELMRTSDNDRVRLAAAQFIIERGWGRAPERIELLAAKVDLTVERALLSPREAYLRLIKGSDAEECLGEPEPLPARTGLDTFLTEEDR